MSLDLGPGGGGKTRPHFLLHHKNCPGHGAFFPGQFEQERTGDLVGEVSHHRQGASGIPRQRLQVEAEDVLADSLHPWITGEKLSLKIGSQGRVNLQGQHPPGFPGQVNRERPQPRTHFYHHVPGVKVKRRAYPPGLVRMNQEVLAPGLFRPQAEMPQNVFRG